jgi:uncharacterized protein
MKVAEILFLVFTITNTLSSSYGQADEHSQQVKIQKELENQLFPGAKLAIDFSFTFTSPFREIYITCKDGVNLSAILFKANKPKGVIIYLHGSNGALDTWGKIAKTYTAFHYDLFMLDYRGYGKSGGKIRSEEQFFSDLQDVYDYVKHIYPEKKIIVLGQSIGTGGAAMLAANNEPLKLILQAPYYSIPDWVHHVEPVIDTSRLVYKFPTYQFLAKTNVPIVIFHGDADEAIYYGSSQKLTTFFKPGDKLITLHGEGHTNFTKNKDYLHDLKIVLEYVGQ